jgi:hypothetical protein
MPAKGQELLLASHIPADSEEQQRPAMLEKRALKLMKVTTKLLDWRTIRPNNVILYLFRY